MQIELVKAALHQKSIVAQLLELYIYDFTEFWDFDIGEDGLYKYEDLPLYWTNPNYHPYLIYVNKKLAGLVLVQKGSPITLDPNLWDVKEFFIMRKYRKKGIGTTIAMNVWTQFKGPWQVRVLVENARACAFWRQAIQNFTGVVPVPRMVTLKKEPWLIYTFTSK